MSASLLPTSPLTGRRPFLASALGSGAALIAASAKADGEQTRTADSQILGLASSPYIYRFKIGTADAWTISDAYLPIK